MVARVINGLKFVSGMEKTMVYTKTNEFKVVSFMEIKLVA